jgi:hypothetical protein
MGLDQPAHTNRPFIPPTLLTVPEAMEALRLPDLNDPGDLHRFR